MQVLDQPVNEFGFLFELGQLLRGRGEDPIPEGLQLAPDHRERGPQLMRDVGEHPPAEFL
jgi:hypothetical protein